MPLISNSAGRIFCIIKNDAIAVKIIAPQFPRFSAACGFPFSLIRTNHVPTTEKTRPATAIIRGKITADIP